MGTVETDHQSAFALQAAVLPQQHVANRAWKNHFDKILTGAEVVADVCTIFAGVLCSEGAYSLLGVGKKAHYPSRVVWACAFGFSVLFVLLLDRDGAYRRSHSLLRIRETERVLRVTLQSFLLILPVAYFSGRLVPRWVYVLAFAFIPTLLLIQKHVFYAGVRSLHERGYGVQRVIIYGAGYYGRRVFSALARSPKLGLRPVAIVDDDPSKIGERLFELDYHRKNSLCVGAGPLDWNLMERYGANMVVVAIPSLGRESFLQVASEAVEHGVQMAFVPDREAGTESWIDHIDLDGLLLASFSQPGSQPTYEFVKRLFDQLLAGAFLVVTAPVLAVLAVLIRLDSKGPVFFRQRRVGKGGKLFWMYKFRSMYTDAPQYGLSPKSSEDSRITRAGRFLRRTSLDELPQLLNVLKGEMSLVGPRPEMPFLVEKYSARQRQRLSVTPGITGLWQISADRAFLIHENIQYDLYYIRNRNFFMDLAIVFHTLVFAARGI